MGKVSWMHNQLCVLSPLLFIFCIRVLRQGRRNVGRAGRAEKKLRAMETYKKTKNRYQLSGP